MKSQAKIISDYCSREPAPSRCAAPKHPFVEFRREELEQSIPSRFEQQVAKYPERIAVKTKNCSVTYTALNQAANRIARAILKHCGNDEKPVALVLEHGVDIIAAILGVLKAGKIYAPLDPCYPVARLRYILDDLQTRVVVTNTHNLSLADKLARGRITIINVDAIDHDIPDKNLDLSISPDRFAYILYTSGSTGQPKGVIQNHRNVLHDCMSYTNNLQICAADRVGLFASCSVGASVHYLFGALLNGATLYPLDIREKGLNYLGPWLNLEKITFFQLSANVFRYFLDTLTGAEEFSHLRLIALGSARVARKDVESYKKHFSPTCLLLNRLSTTETNTLRWHFVDKNTQINTETLPVGYAVEDKEILLLDESGEEVGANDIGEIAVRSRYLSPGYWRRQDLTDAAFFPDPKGKVERIYRTGDIGRMLPDGCLQHLGRKDFRVKIRGFTVEVAEIERSLLEHPNVRESAVVDMEDTLGDKRLVAYIVLNQEKKLTISDFRAFLKAKVPDHMVPSAFMILDALPLTPSGKVDRHALPSPDSTRPQLENAFVGPQTFIEKELAKIWAAVLGFDRVGIHDNFFDLGGHSLLAMVIISRVRDVFRVELPLPRLFETPTVAALANCIETTRKLQHGGEVLPVQPLSRGEQLPLSLAQQSLWFLNQLEPDAAMYNEAMGLRLRGVLNTEALQKTVDAVVARHEVLRSTFSSIDGNPVQVVGQSRSVELPIVDLTHWPAAERETEFQRLAVEITQRPFNLSQDLMLRAALFRLGEKDWALLLVIHHIATDGWSEDILFREFATFYHAFSVGRTPDLPDLPIQYADFILWQREWLQGKVLEQRLSYWKKQFHGIPELLELPTDRPRPVVQSFRGTSESEILSNALTEKLKALSRQEGVTLFMTLLAAFQVLLFRLTGQEDIVVGSPIAGRSRSEFEGLIGLFINTLVLRTDVSGNPSFRELLGRVREVALGAYDHQEVPFGNLMAELQLNRSLSRNTLFQVMFAFRPDPVEQNHKLPGLAISRFRIKTGTAKFDLNLAVYERIDSLHCYFTYNTDLFDASTIKRMAAHFRTLLEGIVSNPEERLSAMPLLSHVERQQLLVEWNDTNRDYPKDTCVHELFQAQVERTPDSVAVMFEERGLTYRELNRRANQLAHYLQKLGVGPEVLVGLYAERSLEMIIALLAILKAGGGYLPLDPSYPLERLLGMDDTQMPVLISQQPLPDKLPRHGTKVIYLHSEWETISRESAENPITKSTANNLAYVIYTSGSTGRSKGVQITHGALTNFVRSACTAFELERNDRVLQFASISFDTAAEEIFPCLIQGARLVLRTDSMLDSVSGFLQRCRDWGITVLDLPTAYWHELVEEISSQLLTVPKKLRLAIIGGERAFSHRLAKWRKVVGDHVRLLNSYGPTEATVVATMWELGGSARPEESLRKVPIGRPISNVQTYILDKHLNPVPVGVRGELYIGGAGLARGFLNCPDLTAEKFIPDPFGKPGMRLYQTGDLARYLPHGNIEFLGRMDNQVKLRGFRVELGEIEAALRQHPAVRETIVLAREDVPGEKRLVAYIVTSGAHSPTTSELRASLQQKVPGYMIPSVFILRESLPLTPNGKLDRKALPRPDMTRPELEAAFVPPRTAVEKVIAEIWAQVLGLERIGIQDNFFELGGHSLLATRVVSRIRDTFEVELPLRRLFEAPTIAALAEVLLTAEHERERIEKTALLLLELTQLSENQVERMLEEKTSLVRTGEKQ